MSKQDQEKLKALRTFLRDADLSEEERDEAETLLDRAEEGDPLSMIQARELAAQRGYEPPFGTDPPIPPGPLMVCPVKPEHYQDYQREVGEVLMCPEHGKPLIPAEGEV